MSVRCESCGMNREEWTSEAVDTLEWEGSYLADLVNQTCCEDYRVGGSEPGYSLLESLPAELNRRRYERSLDEGGCRFCGHTWRHCGCRYD